VNNKFRNVREGFEDNADSAARDEEVTVIVNPNQSNQNNDRSTSRPRFEISESSSRAAIQSSSENQMNIIDCYNCEKLEHFFRNCRQLRKMNSNNFVRKMNVHEKNDSLSQENPESEAKKE
jgi:hypothetical protein